MTALLHHLRVLRRPAPRAEAALGQAHRRDNPVAQARAAGITTAGLFLLASIVGMAICTFWIAITWRAWW